MNNITVTPGEKKGIRTVCGAYLQSRCRHCYADENLFFQVSQTKHFHNIFSSRKTRFFRDINLLSSHKMYSICVPWMWVTKNYKQIFLTKIIIVKVSKINVFLLFWITRIFEVTSNLKIRSIYSTYVLSTTEIQL